MASQLSTSFAILGGVESVDRREQWQGGRLRHGEVGMALQDLDGGDEERHRHLALAEPRQHAFLQIVGVAAERGLDRVVKERPSALAGLAARTRRDVAVGEAGPAVIGVDLDQKRLELLEGPVGKTIGLHERETKPAQRDFCNFAHVLSRSRGVAGQPGVGFETTRELTAPAIQRHRYSSKPTWLLGVDGASAPGNVLPTKKSDIGRNSWRNAWITQAWIT